MNREKRYESHRGHSKNQICERVLALNSNFFIFSRLDQCRNSILKHVDVGE